MVVYSLGWGSFTPHFAQWTPFKPVAALLVPIKAPRLPFNWGLWPTGSPLSNYAPPPVGSTGREDDNPPFPRLLVLKQPQTKMLQNMLALPRGILYQQISPPDTVLSDHSAPQSPLSNIIISSGVNNIRPLSSVGGNSLEVVTYGPHALWRHDTW